MFFRNPSRRHFLQASSVALTSWFTPRNLFGRTPDCSYWFIHAESCTAWSVADPIQWLLDFAHEPILERAFMGLRKLSPEDGDRIIRLVVRRCGLNLLQLRPDQIVVHYWASQRADIRPFFKQHGLARPQVEVVLRERKTELSITQQGDDFLFGERLIAEFPLELFLRKWRSRFDPQPDDWTAAPGTRSGYAWGCIEDNIPWIALKSAWRQATPHICPNCDQPSILINFGQPWTGLLSRSVMFVNVCSACRRSFRDDSVIDVPGWIAGNLGADVQPDSEMMWNQRVKWQPKT